MSEQDILKEYWEYFHSEMNKLGLVARATEELAIQNYVLVNYGYEPKRNAIRFETALNDEAYTAT